MSADREIHGDWANMNPGEQFDLIRRLLKEQDQVLVQLDELDQRIENFLNGLSPQKTGEEIPGGADLPDDFQVLAEIQDEIGQAA